MKRLFLLGAAALLLAACDTLPLGQPNSPPYSGEAYPPAPYAPGPAYPAPAPYPPTYTPGPQLTCPIISSQQWRAWVATPGAGVRPTLTVTGKVVTRTGGYQVTFDRSLQVRKTYPAQAFATVNVFPPMGPASQAQVTHELRGEWPLNQPIGTVEIRCGNETLANIAPVATAN
ncbi:MAG: hypothetical protein ABIN68_04175 [Sphingomicrobium sp.]